MRFRMEFVDGPLKKVLEQPDEDADTLLRVRA